MVLFLQVHLNVNMKKQFHKTMNMKNISKSTKDMAQRSSAWLACIRLGLISSIERKKI